MFGCCCKRSTVRNTSSGPVGAAPYQATDASRVPVIFQHAQPVVEHITEDQMVQRQWLVVARTFLRGGDSRLKLDPDGNSFQLGVRSPKEKFSFLVTDPWGPRKVLTLLSVPATCPLPLYSSSGKFKFQRTMQEVAVCGQFPFIQPTVSAEYLAQGNKVAIVRVFDQTPTLREEIYGPPGESADTVGSPMTLQQTASYGRQMLETICFLRCKEVLCAHLHSGNVFLDRPAGIVRLSDVENGLLGLDHQLKSFIQKAAAHIRTRKPGAHCDIDLIAFYYVLHEMILGYAPGSSPSSPDPLKIPQTCPRDVKQVFKGILNGTLDNPVAVLDTALFEDATLPDAISSFKSYKHTLAERLEASQGSGSGLGAAAAAAAAADVGQDMGLSRRQPQALDGVDV